DFLVGLGVTDAVNLDGGGGTVFVTGATVVNRPSDNNPTDPTRYVERGAANAFVVMSRPLPPPPPPPVSGPPGTVPGVSGAAPSGPATQTANPLGDLPSGPSVGVGGDAGSGDLPLGTAGSAPGGAAALAPARPAADGVLPVKAVGAAGAGDRSTGHGEAGKAAPGGGIHSTLSTVSTVAGDVISPLMGSGTPWRLGSRGDAAVAGTAVLLTAAWARRRFRGNPFDFGC
ncbi:MAG TPA: phosphodiester glycosidase family protein, partial [Acidimicrobiia bacterium]|nr:phosphodiester glycosidase family protein [Acidimicrobiia bacterium]